MKNIVHYSSLIFAIALLSACSSNQGLSSYEDDIYYSTKADKATLASAYEPVAQAEEYIDIDERDYGYDTESAAQKSQDEYYDPEFKANQAQSQKANPVNNYYGNRYEDDDYYYSNRNRRFASTQIGFGYYSPYYSYGNWYSFDPFYPRPNYWNPYYSPGVNYGWNSYSGWSYSYSNWGPGWGMNYGYGYPFGYSSFYGGGYNNNYYCPSAFNGGNGNDYFNNRTSIYSGQFTPYSSSAASNSSDMNKGFRAAAIKDLNGELRPASLQPNLYQGTRPVNAPAGNVSERPSNMGRPNADLRPMEQGGGSSPAEINGTESRPSQVEREAAPSYVRPEPDQVGPVQTRPQAEPAPTEQPRQEPRPNSQERRRSNEGSMSTPRSNNTGNTRTSSPSRSTNDSSTPRRPR